jgi:hypothetical protein
VEDGACIPRVPGNRDYEQALADIAEDATCVSDAPDFDATARRRSQFQTAVAACVAAWAFAQQFGTNADKATARADLEAVRTAYPEFGFTDLRPTT